MCGRDVQGKIEKEREREREPGDKATTTHLRLHGAVLSHECYTAHVYMYIHIIIMLITNFVHVVVHVCILRMYPEISISSNLGTV